MFCALPFLAARVAYAIGGAFTSQTSVFSITDGSDVLYALLSVFTELAFVLIYAAFALVLPLDEDVMNPQGSSDSIGYTKPATHTYPPQA